MKEFSKALVYYTNMVYDSWIRYEKSDIVSYIKDVIEELGIKIINNDFEDGLIKNNGDGSDYNDVLRSIDSIILLATTNDCINYEQTIRSIVNTAKDRDKKIFIVTEFDIGRSWWIYDYHNKKRLNDEDSKRILSIFAGCFFYQIVDGWIPHDMKPIILSIYNEIHSSNEIHVLYDKLYQFKSLHHNNGVLSVLCKLIERQCIQIKNSHQENVRKSIYKSIIKNLFLMENEYPKGSDYEIRNLSHAQLNVISQVKELLKENEFLEPDLYFSAYALAVIYLFALIQNSCVENITNDDVHLLRETNRREAFMKEQQKYLHIIVSAKKDDKNFTSELENNYSVEEIKLIDIYDKMLVSNLTVDSHGGVFIKSGNTLYSPVKIPDGYNVEVSQEDRILLKISENLKQVMKLFDSISDTGKESEFFRCLKTAYERLKNYSEIVGSYVVVEECIDRIAEITNRLAYSISERTADDKAEIGIKTLLGLKTVNQGDFDIFISYKHEDIDIGTNCYYFCKENHIQPFFDKITLPELSSSDYEEAIMNALDKSKHFLVILTDLKQLESHWIKLEMKTFEHEMSEGRKLGANFIFLVSENVYSEIIKTNKKCLPIQFRQFEVMKISEYKRILSNYLK